MPDLQTELISIWCLITVKLDCHLAVNHLSSHCEWMPVMPCQTSAIKVYLIYFVTTLEFL